MSKKRRREIVTVDTRLVEIYEDLTNEDEDVQLKAAQALLSLLSPSNNPTVEEIEKAIRRLFRGLCSGRKAARLGFSITLTELLAQVFANANAGGDGPKLSVDQVFDILLTLTSPGGNISGQEERDHHFGRVFGAEAVLKSSVLFSSSSPLQDWKKLLDLVFDLAVKKPWLREECGWVVYSSILDLPAKVHDSSYAEAAIELLNSHQLARTPEGVAMWISAKRCFPTMKFPHHIWHKQDPLNSHDKQTLAAVLKEASVADQEASEADPKSQKGNWSPHLHFAWNVVLEEFYGVNEQPGWSHKNQKPKRMNFVDFWEIVVDNSLFSAGASDERKHWGFQLFIQVVKDAPQYLKVVVFSKNMLRCLVNQLTERERFLHRMAERALKTIKTKGTSDPDFAAAAIKGLIGPYGTINFDQITKTKTVEKLLGDAGQGDMTAITDYFMSLINESRGDEKAVALKRQKLADYLVSSLRSRSSQTKSSDVAGLAAVAKDILVVLAHFGFFINATPRPPISAASQEMFRSRLVSCLNNLMGTHSELVDLPYEVITIIHEKQQNDQTSSLVIELDETASESLEGAWRTLRKITKKVNPETMSGPSRHTSWNALKLLYSLAILQVYNGDPDAVAILEELKVCYSDLRNRSSTKAKSDAGASETLVEILLSFASKPSKLFAKVTEQVFETFSAQLNTESLQLLLNVLDTKENLAGQQELFDGQGEDEEGDDVDDEDEIMSDVEVDEEGVAEEEGDEESASGSEEGPSSDDEEDQEELAAFESKLAVALGAHRGEDEMNASDHESSSDEDMDDEEMEKLEGKLVEIFKARKLQPNKKKELKDAKEMMVNFKGRVLSLLEIYVKRQHSSEIVLSLILPLLRVIRTTNTKHIADKSFQILRELNKLCKSTDLIQLSDVDAAWTLLRQIHAQAALPGSNAFGTACSQSSLLLVKTLVGHQRDSISAIVEVYGETRKRQLQDKTCHVQVSFFSDWNNWCVSASQQLRA